MCLSTDCHRFIRDDENPKDVSWEEQLARAYESKLFKEFALVDLKHYKSNRIALRWRTAEEVVASIGEETCASLRCPYHSMIYPAGESTRRRELDLQAFELPFSYMEQGQQKSALVKVRVCSRCAKKLLYRSRQENRPEQETTNGSVRNTSGRDRSSNVRDRSRSRSPRRDRHPHGATRSRAEKR